MSAGQSTMPSRYQFLLFLALVAASNAQNVDFSFSSTFGNGELLGDGNYTISDTGVLLLSVNNSNLNQQTGGSLASRAVYARPVQLYDAATGAAASFNTFFSFGMLQGSGYCAGDGLTFVIAPTPGVPLNSQGGFLGLYNGNLYSWAGDPALQMVAVELDTYQQPQFDPNNNHVGLDINSLKSVKAQDLGPFGFRLNESYSLQRVDTWIDYDAAAQQLQVYLGHGPGSSKSAAALVLSYTGFNLSSYVRNESYVGFTAATGLCAQENYIYDWQFSTQGLPQARAPAPAPAPAPALTPPGPSTSAAGEGSNSTGNGTSGSRSSDVGLIGGVVGGLVGLLVLVGLGLCCCCIWWKRRAGSGSGQGEESLTDGVPSDSHASYPSSGDKKTSSSGGQSSTSSWDDLYAPQVKYGPRPFSYQELKDATRGFSAAEMLGFGGFGHVYRGLIRNPDGSEMTVAIKRIAQNSKQGEREFRAEVLSIGRLRHRNLVHLLGWCHEQGELLLVYEFMTNFSLDRHLYSEHGPMRWDYRFHILQGVAAALVYIHTESPDRCILHRDLKPSNVMLDSKMTARLGDFGLARLIEDSTADPGTGLGVSLTQVAGTRGYLAPELVVAGKATTKTDIFSFGVLALEVASGKKPGAITQQNSNSDEQIGLVDWVWQMQESGNLLAAADPALEGRLDIGQLRRVLHVGLLCTLSEPKFRPSTKHVQQILREDVPLPPVPQAKPTPTYWLPAEDGVDSSSAWRPDGL